MRSRLGILGGFTAVVVVGVLGFVLFVALRQTPKAFTLGVQSGGPVVTLRAGQTACQAPVDVPRGGAFDRVRLKVGTYFKAGPPLRIAIHRGADGPVLARGVLRGGYRDIGAEPTQLVALDHKVAAGTEGLAVCVENDGPDRIALYGNGDAANRISTATRDGKAVGVDIDMIFERAPRSYGSELSAILSRAVLFRSPRLSGTLYLLVLVLLVAGAVGGVAAALRSAGGEDAEDEAPRA